MTYPICQTIQCDDTFHSAPFLAQFNAPSRSHPGWALFYDINYDKFSHSSQVKTPNLKIKSQQEKF